MIVINKGRILKSLCKENNKNSSIGEFFIENKKMIIIIGLIDYISEDYKELDIRIKVFHTDNKGVTEV